MPCSAGCLAAAFCGPVYMPGAPGALPKLRAGCWRRRLGWERRACFAKRSMLSSASAHSRIGCGHSRAVISPLRPPVSSGRHQRPDFHRVAGFDPRGGTIQDHAFAASFRFARRADSGSVQEKSKFESAASVVAASRSHAERLAPGTKWP